MVRKLVSALMITLLVMHLAGFYVYFVVRLGEIRMTMREKLADLPDEQLQVLRIPADQFKQGWMEERELKWQGKMYDIARADHLGEFMIVYCLHDEDEDGLLNFITTVVETSSQDTQQAPGSVVQFFLLKFVVNQASIPVRPIITRDHIDIPYLLEFSSISTDPLSPPPRG